MSHLELLSPIEWSIAPEFIINLDHPFNIVVFWLKRYWQYPNPNPNPNIVVFWLKRCWQYPTSSVYDLAGMHDDSVAIFGAGGSGGRAGGKAVKSGGKRRPSSGKRSD